MARVTVEDCIDKIPNRFDLVLASAQRARNISTGNPLTIDRDNDKNPVVALREIAEEMIPIDDISESLVKGLQRHVEVDEPEEENENLKLRVYVTGGGCSGFQYGFSFEDSMAEDDTPVSREGVTVLVDSLSFQYLAGSTVDYEVGLMGSRFIITNPNASTTCGCGASFSI